MAQEYDVVLKLLFRSKTSRAVREIAGGPVMRWLDKELPAIRNTRADLVGETIGGELVHLEFMSVNQTFFELRMAGLPGIGPTSASGAGLRGAREAANERPFQEPDAELPVPGGGLA